MNLHEYIERLLECIEENIDLQRAYLNDVKFHHLVNLGKYLNKEPISLGQMRDQFIPEPTIKRDRKL